MERTQEFDIPAHELWEAVTDPDRMGWLGDEVSLDVRPGGAGRITDGDETREVLVETVDAGRQLSFRWWPEGDEELASRVDLIVTPRPDGSRLVVRETLPASLATTAILNLDASTSTAEAGVTPSGPGAWDRRILLLGLATLRPVAVAATGPRC